jgi:putative PIN family toxin of toxin-antitoxin system
MSSTVKAVIDTNVLVSALYNSNGIPAEVTLLMGSRYTPYVSKEIVCEYERVLSYPRLNILPSSKQTLLTTIAKIAVCIDEIQRSTIALPHEADRVFYDLSVFSEAWLVTGNAKHYTQEPFIITPRQFLDKLQLENWKRKT